MAEDLVSLRIKIEGVVQGVGFRAFAVRQAEARNLNGWVRNRLDSTVEMLASGERKDIEAFITACIRGPMGAHVANIDLFAATPPEQTGFSMCPSL